MALNQHDPRWAAETLGNTRLTLANFGCLVTCLSMLSAYYHDKFKTPFLLPGELARRLKFTQEGFVIWESLPKVLGFELSQSLKVYDPVAIDASLKNEKGSVLLNVLNFGHFVLATGKPILPFSGLYKINDPWSGDSSTMKRYNNIINGSRHFILS